MNFNQKYAQRNGFSMLIIITIPGRDADHSPPSSAEVKNE
jgi:hypothetical protein